MSRLRLAVIGVGHLGKEHARILAGLSDVELVGVVDVNAAQAEAVGKRAGGLDPRLVSCPVSNSNMVCIAIRRCASS